MAIFFTHTIRSIGSQHRDLTALNFYANTLKWISKNIIVTILILLLFSCEKEEPSTPIQDPCEQAGNKNSNLISKIPHQIGYNSIWYTFGRSFYGLSVSNHFLFGSPAIGTGPAKSESFEIALMNSNGQTLWHKSLGIGQTTFGAFFDDKILISGWIRNMDDNLLPVSKVYDRNGTELMTNIHDQIVFRSHFYDQLGNLYLSNASNLYYYDPIQIIKLSSALDIQQHYLINYPVRSFLVNQEGDIMAFYADQSNAEAGLIMIDRQGQEKWDISLADSKIQEGRLVQINDQRYGLITTECKTIPCATDIMYYEFGSNGALINPGQKIASSITLDMLINNSTDEKEKFYFDDIQDVLAFDEEVLVVFRASTKNYSALMIKGTLGSSLEHWWEGDALPEIPRSLRHISLRQKDGRLEWKTFCGQAICTFQLDKGLEFNSCF